MADKTIPKLFCLTTSARLVVWGIDIQLHTFIDKPQLDYFRSIADEHVRADDRIISLTAKPSWMEAPESESQRNLAHFVRHVIEPSPARLAVSIAGDWHHYARYASKAPTGNGGWRRGLLVPDYNLPDSTG